MASSGEKFFGVILVTAIGIPIAILTGFLIDLLIALLLWLPWTVFGLGEIYGYMLPEVFQSMPYWHVVGLIVVVSQLRSVIIRSPAKLENPVE